ncbi:MAG: metallophosphoesterase, partial [Planctomycetota bacterium]
LMDIVSGSDSVSNTPQPLLVFLATCVAMGLHWGIPWLAYRPILGWEWAADVKRESELIDTRHDIAPPATAVSPVVRWTMRLPINQMMHLDVACKTVPIHQLPAAMEGYRIAHLTDLHLTGDLSIRYQEYAVQRAMEFRPDLIALTGDIVDHDPCIDWVEGLLAPMHATDGCYFLLGNHDLRVSDPELTRAAMVRAGWIDCGGKTIETRLAGAAAVLQGDERPWFEGPENPPAIHDDIASVGHGEADTAFRLLLAHSPDRFPWARQHSFQLMLAGHTHGGQGRLPLIGPLLGPSYHGSRYASGTFRRDATTMHVSRGLGGVHPIRINCPPELALITLTSAG